MTSPSGPPTVRRPLPALVFLLALTLLAALVWWRVLARDDGHAATEPACTPSTASTAPKHLPERAAVTVQVLNSTKRQGIATRAQKVLTQAGFDTPAAAANDSKDYPGYSGEIKGVAQIRYGPSGKPGAQLLHYYFPDATMVPTGEKDATVLVSLGETYSGKVLVATAKQVPAKLRAAGITLVRVSGAVPQGTPSAGSCASPTS
jgi:hypothetical protein